MKNRRIMALLLAVTALVASGACKSDNKVGNKSLLDFKEQANNRLGETTTTTAPATTTTAKGAATTTTRPGTKPGAAATTTTAKGGPAATATTATTAPQSTQAIREIDIGSDDAPQPLDPQVQTAYTGSIIRWVNKDTVARAVRADSGQFASPMIQPGKSWDYTAGTVGVFAYSDDTRPYVHGELRVSKP
jgi:plastocyanin